MPKTSTPTKLFPSMGQEGFKLSVQSKQRSLVVESNQLIQKVQITGGTNMLKALAMAVLVMTTLEVLAMLFVESSLEVICVTSFSSISYYSNIYYSSKTNIKIKSLTLASQTFFGYKHGLGNSVRM